MFLILDTNHYVALVAGGPLSKKLERMADAVGADLFLTVITPQESAQGWLAAINSLPAGPRQVFHYDPCNSLPSSGLALRLCDSASLR